MPQSPIEAVVFDCDGLMFNTEDVFELTGQELMRRRGLEMTAEVRAQMTGRRAREAFAALIEMMKLTDDIEDLITESGTIFRGFLDEHLDSLPGLFELLDHLGQRDIPRAVATSSERDYLNGLLTRFELTDRFLFTLTAEDVSRGKPDPEIYRTACERLALPPERVVVLEDSPAGIASASSAGTVAVAVPSRHTSGGDFSPATHIINSLTDPKLRAILTGEV